jgi:hypothetical protein
VRNYKPLLVEFQRVLQEDGIELVWPKITPR